MNILGINAYHPDSSAALIVNGKLVAAVEEERFTRIKHFAGFPKDSVKYCLREGRLNLGDIDYIALPRSPYARFLKKMYYGVKIPALLCHRLYAWEKTLTVKRKLSDLFGIDESLIRAKIVKVEHHRAHLASSFFVSNFEEAFLFSADALGDFGSTVWGIGKGNSIRVLGEVAFPHSLGFFYTALTQYLGFLKFGDEYKVMGLAAYGKDAFGDELKEIVQIKKDTFHLNLKYFLHHKKYIDMNFEDGYPHLDLIFSPYLEKRLGARRGPGQPIEARHKNIAFSLQKRLEEVLFCLLKTHSLKGYSNLCLSGGVAFNCVANGKIFENTQFNEVYISPAPGDAGLAIGAAFYLWNQALGKPRQFVMEHAYWGPAYSETEIGCQIEARKGDFQKSGCTIKRINNEDELCEMTAGEIAQGKVIGWFQGRVEWGPRALGNRSIVVDPRREEMKATLNRRIKHREPFRPFAPSILEEDISDYFKCSHLSPFMLFAFEVKDEEKDAIAAVVHTDGSARLQTVAKTTNPRYWRLIDAFKKATGVPVVLNTSFNENEPIVCTPQEAIDCFLRTEMDILVIGEFVIRKHS
ncbi:MAG: carbamoyltransferase [Candidatus Omnitrophota bacterium]|nr:MAG: carbamoyltransferase [Candidatus Omnitrophota bacterium]